MPKRIIIIGILFCLGGLLAIWQIISDISQSRINLNFGILWLPVGIGLLKGKPRSQWWARFWFILGYIFCTILAGAVFIWPGNAHSNLFGREMRGYEAIPYVILYAVLLAGFLFVLHKLLYSTKAVNYFSRDGE